MYQMRVYQLILSGALIASSAAYGSDIGDRVDSQLRAKERLQEAKQERAEAVREVNEVNRRIGETGADRLWNSVAPHSVKDHVSESQKEERRQAEERFSKANHAVKEAAAAKDREERNSGNAWKRDPFNGGTRNVK